MFISEDQLNTWASPPSETENERCEAAIKQISDVLKNKFGDKIFFIRQGSHRNRTNIKLDSDIDIAVVHKDYYFPDTSFLSESERLSYETARIPADYSFSQFKTDVHTLLKNEFGISSVERKNKCIRVNGNTYRVNADVVPVYEHRRYNSSANNDIGIELVTDKEGMRICSFPEQHYENGVKKNSETNRAYKSVVRILKNMRNQFIDKGLLKDGQISSFFIESLVWNVSNNCFHGSTWREDTESVILRLWSDMRDPDKAKNYAEVSNLKWLFRGNTTRTPQQAENFMLEAFNYIKK